MIVCGPRRLALDEEQGLLYVATNTNRIHVVNLRANSVSSITVSSGSHSGESLPSESVRIGALHATPEQLHSCK